MTPLASVNTGSPDLVTRLFERDTSLWTNDAAVSGTIENRLGWLSSAEWTRKQLPALKQWMIDILFDLEFGRVVVLGMGGSSLAPNVFANLFAPRPDFAQLTVLDSTAPEAIAAELAQDSSNTLYIVASKSGTTLETTDLYRVFYDQVSRCSSKPGQHFVAITDPGSWLEQHAKDQGFLKTFINPPDIGGRYSALSFFGMVPAAIAGVDVETLIDRACDVAQACRNVDLKDNPGLRLGQFIGQQTIAGRDKMFLVRPDPLYSVSAWIEQLVAESTGKDGKGILPVCVRQSQFTPSALADDCFAVVLNNGMEAASVENTRCYRLGLCSTLDIGGLFFQWQVATAIASSYLGVNSFDEPNVSEAKQSTQQFIETDATLNLVIKRDKSSYTMAVAEAAKSPVPFSASTYLSAESQHYVAVLAYFPITDEHCELLASFSETLSARYNVCCTTGFGPRYLHSTGQLHKGGAQTGRFIQIVQEQQEDNDIPVPGRDYTFGELIKAQADGDMAILAKRGLPVLRIVIKARAASAIADVLADFEESIQ